MKTKSGYVPVKKVPGKSMTKEAMIRHIDAAADESEEDLDGIIEEFCEDIGVSTIRHLTIPQLRRLYADVVNPPIDTIKKESPAVENFEATIITDKTRRLVRVHIEDADGKFLTPDYQREERALGAEMPVFLSVPQEIYEAIRRA